jgi:hypothetical protein
LEVVVIAGSGGDVRLCTLIDAPSLLYFLWL